MQFSVVALAALVATVSAAHNGTVVYTTEVHTAYTTVCPASTELTFNGITYTATESTTLTITNCPCTVVKPVTTSSVVYCNTCTPTNTPVAPVYTNGTTAVPTVAPTTTKGSVGTTLVPSAGPTTTPISASNGNKMFAFSGASLAGLLGLAAYVL